jgi:hypothetical protein
MTENAIREMVSPINAKPILFFILNSIKLYDL